MSVRIKLIWATSFIAMTITFVTFVQTNWLFYNNRFSALLPNRYVFIRQRKYLHVIIVRIVARFLTVNSETFSKTCRPLASNFLMVKLANVSL